jgi:hypothetical protein
VVSLAWITFEWVAGSQEALDLDTEQLVRIFGIPVAEHPDWHLLIGHVIARANNNTRDLTLRLDPDPDREIFTGDEHYEKNVFPNRFTTANEWETFHNGHSLDVEVRDTIRFDNDSNSNTWTISIEYFFVDGGGMDWREEIQEMMPDYVQVGRQRSPGGPQYRPGDFHTVVDS